jgi:hypothetical protein
MRGSTYRGAAGQPAAGYAAGQYKRSPEPPGCHPEQAVHHETDHSGDGWVLGASGAPLPRGCTSDR